MIFADANYLIALFIKDHDHNKQALKIWDKINQKKIVISNSIILEVMTVLNIKLKVSQEQLEKAYSRLYSGRFGIVEDIHINDKTMQRMITYLPERLPFFDCLYIELMKQLEIKEIVSFDEHFDNKESIIRVY
jgi:predicted nucleic acid-binding protein